MKFRSPYLESIFLALLGAVFCLVANTSLPIKILNFAYHASLWPERSLIISQLLIVYGFLLIGLAGFDLYLSTRGPALKIGRAHV